MAIRDEARSAESYRTTAKSDNTTMQFVPPAKLIFRASVQMIWEIAP